MWHMALFINLALIVPIAYTENLFYHHLICNCFMLPKQAGLPVCYIFSSLTDYLNLHILLLRTGFEEDKNFHVVLNSVIAGRYHVTEYLGSAAFSKAIQAHDLHTSMDVCVKIIKNNKDFFDQSLDEIKLLKYVNKHDPGDKYHILRLYDYFYYRVSENMIQHSINFFFFFFKCCCEHFKCVCSLIFVSIFSEGE